MKPADRLTKGGEEVLSLALREALAYGDNYIGPAHLLLAALSYTAPETIEGASERARLSDIVRRSLPEPRPVEEEPTTELVREESFDAMAAAEALARRPWEQGNFEGLATLALAQAIRDRP